MDDDSRPGATRATDPPEQPVERLDGHTPDDRHAGRADGPGDGHVSGSADDTDRRAPDPEASRVTGQAGVRSRRLALWIAALVVVVDQVVKYAVEQALEPGQFVPWLSDDIGWQLVYNDAGAFGLPLPSWSFLVVAAVVVVVVVRALPRVVRVVPAVAYGLLVAGAIGNVVDRVVRLGDPGDPRWLHGHVVDFVAWGSFPRFNVADAAITIGFVLLATDLWRHGDDSALPGVEPTSGP